MKKKLFLKLNIFIILLFFIFYHDSFPVQAADSYPKLASHFLKWEVLDSEVAELARWDLLTLDMEVQINSPEQIAKIKKLNPNIIILAYINSVEILDNVKSFRGALMRNSLAAGVIDEWWLKDDSGNKISNWPSTSMLNLTNLVKKNSQGEQYNDYVARFVNEKIKSSGLWDGVFFDNTWGDVAWINGGNIDANNDGRKDDINTLNNAWSQGFKNMLQKTRNLTGSNFIIIGNGRSFEGYQEIINGMMYEGFPSNWENDGTWAGSMKSYLYLSNLNKEPNTSIINSFSENYSDYPYFRFTLGSALLGNGFFTFNYSTNDYSDSRWYDEYDVVLGVPKSGPYNLLADRSTEIKPGLWRRDFQYGSVIINSTNKEQLYVFSKEEVEKIKGSQDPKFNTGEKISYIKLAPQDGIVFLRYSNMIYNNTFVNGYFYRLYNQFGDQTRNGFFAYLNSFPGESEVVVFDNLGGNQEVEISAGFGEVKILSNGKVESSFFPYTKNYRDRLNIAVKTKNGKIDQVITGPYKGGPQVNIFSATGKQLGGFFAYDKNLRTGVNIVVGDVDGDGIDDIITGPGAGTEPMIKIFSFGGVLKKSFLAYDKNFRGGVSVALVDVNGDGKLEIVTGPGAGGGPHIRAFNAKGEVMANFFAFDQNFRGGVKVGAGSVGHDGRQEILVGIKNFY